MHDKDTLQIIADNTLLLDAVRRVFERQFDTKYELIESNETLGERLRARLVGLKAVEMAVKEIEACESKREKLDVPMNPAR